MGQNGSGKSTLIKVLAGYHQPDHGTEAELDGEAFDIGHVVPDGLRFVHQDLGLVLELSAQDNLALHGGFARASAGAFSGASRSAETYRMLERFDVDLDIHQPLAAATPVERTVVAIAAALQGWEGGGGVLVLDEPTAVLPHDEVERLFDVVRGGPPGRHGDSLRVAPDGRDLRSSPTASRSCAAESWSRRCRSRRSTRARSRT